MYICIQHTYICFYVFIYSCMYVHKDKYMYNYHILHMSLYAFICIYRYIFYTLYFNKYTCLRLFLLVFQTLELPQSPFQERHRRLRSLCRAHRCPPAQSNDAMAEACGNGGRKQPYPSVCQRCHISQLFTVHHLIHRKWKLQSCAACRCPAYDVHT